MSDMWQTVSVDIDPSEILSIIIPLQGEGWTLRLSVIDKSRDLPVLTDADC